VAVDVLGEAMQDEVGVMEPLAEGHVHLGLALLACDAVLLHDEERVEREGHDVDLELREKPPGHANN